LATEAAAAGSDGSAYLTADAIADYSNEMMHAALEINMPNYASAIVTTRDIIEALSTESLTAFDPAGVD
jgi:isochorismate hydrolase